MSKENNLLKSFIGVWKDLNETIITIKANTSPSGESEVDYGNGRGPFIGSSFSDIIPPTIEVNFTDDGGIKTGVMAEEGLAINWNNNTKWVRQ